MTYHQYGVFACECDTAWSNRSLGAGPVNPFMHIPRRGLPLKFGNADKTGSRPCRCSTTLETALYHEEHLPPEPSVES